MAEFTVNMRDQTQIRLPFNSCRGLKSINSSTHKRSIESAGESAGFTLFDILIVLAIIGILTTIALPILLKYRTKANNALVVSEIRILEQEILIYHAKRMRLPDDLGEVKLGNISDPWGNPYQYLKIAEDDDGEIKKGKDINKGEKENSADEKKGLPRKDFFLVPANSDYDLYSMGKDGKSQASFTAKASHDDIVRVNDGQFVGLVSEF